MTKSNVVVVGGGRAGIEIAKQLSQKLDASKYELIMITSRPFSIWLPPLVRAVVTSEGNLESLETGSLVPYDKFLAAGKGTVRFGTVVSVETPSGDEDNKRGGVVVLENGERVPYAALVLAPGSRWADPFNMPRTKLEVDAYVNTWRNNFKKAKHVLFIGGGSLSVELAGEVRDLYPHKPITIVQGPDALLNSAYPLSYRERVKRAAIAREIEVLTNEYVDVIPEGDFVADGVNTRSGKHINADLVISTRGIRPATEFLASSGVPLTTTGYVKAKGTLQVEGFTNVFVAGDALDFDEQKQSAKYGGHTAVVVPNLLAVLEGKEPEAKYTKQPEKLLITLGKNDGVTYLGNLWGVELGGWFSRWAKGGDFLLSKYRHVMGQ